MSEMPGLIASIAGMGFLLAGKEILALAGQEILVDSITLLDTTLPMINLLGAVLVVAGVIFMWQTY